jgi:two-component system chemotaxis response regulator CheB
MSIRVLVIDESAAVRDALERGLARDPDIEVLGSAADPYAALNKILALKPDVITLELSMPRMDGITFLTQVKENLKIPVIVCSSLTQQNSAAAVAALDAGATDIVTKPTDLSKMSEIISELRDKLKLAANHNSSERPTTTSNSHSYLPPQQTPPLNRPSSISTATLYTRILLLGASTGGTQAIEKIVKDFPEHCPPTVIVQHMPAGFTAAFAKRLDGLYAPRIKEAEDGDEICSGKVLVAPGDFHLTLQKIGSKVTCVLDKTPPVGGHRPAVDVLFNSAASVLKERAVGVILTGMGADGAKGLLALRQNGAYTIAQNQESCVVFGMPRAAIECGASCDIFHLDQIATIAIQSCQNKKIRS